jgi:hypothetical protein
MATTYMASGTTAVKSDTRRYLLVKWLVALGSTEHKRDDTRRRLLVKIDRIKKGITGNQTA